jgi:hypothetical protein
MFESIKEISVFQADLIKSFAIFYLFVVINYIGPSLFPCYEINYINSHKWFQLLISFMLFYFLIILVSDTGKLEFTPPIEKLINSFFYFIGFLFVMRLDMKITLIVLFLIFTIYFIELNKDFYLEKGKEIYNSSDKRVYNDNMYWITLNWPTRLRLFPVNNETFTIINKVETILYYIIVFFLVIGVISYGGEIHDNVSKSKNVTWIDVISDTSICKFKTRKSFWHYFKIGLGLRI